jgi:hypothetical protein
VFGQIAAASSSKAAATRRRSWCASTWEGFHDGQLSVFQDFPGTEFGSVVLLETVLFDYRDQLEAEVQRAHIVQAIANAILGETLETLEFMLSDLA